MTQSTEQERARVLFNPYTGERRHISDVQSDPQGLLIVAPGAELQAARRAPSVPETIEQRAKKLKGLQVLIGATAGVPEAIEQARSRFIEAYGRSPLHDDLAYACLLIDAYGGAPAAPLPQEVIDALDRMDALLKPGLRLLAVGDESATAQASRRDMATIRAALAAAPQPPEADHIEQHLEMVAAPVQLPEHVYTLRIRGRLHDHTPALPAFDLEDGEHKLYTEQQVRQLLSAREQST